MEQTILDMVSIIESQLIEDICNTRYVVIYCAAVIQGLGTDCDSMCISYDNLQRVQ